MKRILALSIVIAMPWLAWTQVKPLEPWSNHELSTFVQNHILGIPMTSYDTITGERVAYSGIAIQLIRAPQPLQLVNPWAPEAYAPREQNLVVDPITKRPVGLIFFAIKF